MFMDMDVSSFRSSTPSFTIVATASPSPHPVVLLWHLALLSLPLFVRAQYSNNPLTNWTISEFYDVNQTVHYFRYRNFTYCNNDSSNLQLLNDEQALYSSYSNGPLSAHYFLPYTVIFCLHFVTPAEKICTKRNESIPVYYLSLVALNAYGRTQDPNKGQVVWTANPMNPVTKNACLRLDGSNLTLLDHKDNMGSSPRVVWQIATRASNLSLGISFEGNLVLFSNTTDPPYQPSWESFGQPTDTLMVLQVLDNNSNLTTANWKSSATSNSVNYTLALKNGRLVLYATLGQLIQENGSIPHQYLYWTSFPNISASANNDNFSFATLCWDSVHQLRLYVGSNRSSNVSSGYRGMVSPEFCSTISNNSDTTMEITGLDQSINATFATFLRLEADGDLRAYTVDNTTYPGSNATWRAFYSLFNTTPCALPFYCGFYGLCVPRGADNNSYCRCDYSNDPKLVFSDPSNPKAGCNPESGDRAQLWGSQNKSTRTSGQASECPTTDNIAACTSKDWGCKVNFIEVDGVYYFSLNFTESHPGKYESDGCKGECEKNCSCTAAFWDQSTGSCFLVQGQLGTIQQQQGSMKAFIRYVEITPSSSFPLNKLLTIVLLLASALIVACVFLAYRRRRRAHKNREIRKERLLLLSVLDGGNTERFTWKQMHEYTCGFSDLVGAGGFGRVFRGALPDGTAIAVKQLDDQGQGEKEFIAEVSILSRIHHAHLVRLIGFCLQGMHRLLVYEYMENGSLDAWIFKRNVTSTQDMNQKDKEKKVLLPWKTRFQIAVGTAKGLAYLHEECEERVIHMDLKPQNILLSRNFLPKISDFGMSRRTAREQTSVMTVMRGTPGYLAPEWLVDAAITEKCDVYSYGIMLLEMVSGRKVKDVRGVKQRLSMRPLRESVMQEFLDERLRYDMSYGHDVEEKEAVRMVEVAMMCVRTDPTKRPAMSSVALMLEGRGEAVQAIDSLAFDDGEDAELQQQLVTYPSGMNRTMRTGKLHSFTSSFTDTTAASSQVLRGSSSSGNIWSSISLNKKKNKMYSISHAKDKASEVADEWDSLL